MSRSIFISIKTLSAGLVAGVFSLLLVGCSDTGAETQQQTAASAGSTQAQDLTLYKSPTCGCCTAWGEHIEHEGFSHRSEHPADLDGVKDHFGVRPQYRSCHLAVSRSGYVFEGHVPAKTMRRFLKAPPEGAIGLAVPGMPVGSPGMEVDERFDPYQVLLLKADGSAEVYASFRSYEEQF